MGFRRNCFGVLFWLKATFAFCAGCSLYGFLVYLVITKRNNAINGVYEKKIDVDPNNINCHAGRTDLGRLEIAEGRLMYGFHIKWIDNFRPVDYAAKLGKKPPIL